jgi:hypothetical protein
VVRPAYVAAPAVQQPPKLEGIEQYRMQMAGISTAAMGYWKEGDSIHPDYDTPALRDVAKLYAQYDALYKAQQPQADQSLRQDALQSLAYANGAKAGWNLAVADDEAGFAKIMDQVPEAVRTLKQTRAEQPQAEAMPLPERDATKTAEQQGLFRKFVVRRTDGSDAPGGKHDGCDYFVLDVTHDKHAKAALAVYAASVEETHPQLAADMRNRYELPAPQQAEAVPSDVVRDAAPIPDHELVTMYDERPTSDREMIEFAREVERRHGIGVQPQHITDGSPCWCNPDVAYTDPETGASVIVHRRPQ